VAEVKSSIKICNKNSIAEQTHEAEQNSASNPIAVSLAGMRKGLFAKQTSYGHKK